MESAFRVLFFAVAILTATAQDDASNTTDAMDFICRACVCKDGKVDCNDQNIEKFFSPEEWAGLTDFKPIQVDLSTNYIKSVTVVKTILPIEVLNLSRNSIENIEQASFKILSSLRVIDLSYNNLTADKLMPHVFEGNYVAEKYEPLGKMRVLNLAYNDLHSLHQDLFQHLSDLEELDLSGNPLNNIDYSTIMAISSLSKLKVLRLRRCQIKSVPDKFLHTPRFLQRLDLSGNQLKMIPQELEETNNLLYLNLNQNPIERLDVKDQNHLGFPLMEKLTELHMSNMPDLTFIGESSMGGLQKLKVLHMSYNKQLESIDPKALAIVDDIGENYDWPLLSELHLKANNLTSINSGMLARWDLLKSIDVSENPFLCDCTTQWMVDILTPLVASGGKSNTTENMVCAQPSQMSKYTMKHLNAIHRKMRCVDKYGNHPEKDGAILLGTVIGILLAVPIMLSLVLLWRRGYCGWLGFKGPTHVSRAFYRRAPMDDTNYI